MQRVFTVAAALVLFACGTTFAQSPTTRSTALMGLTNPTIQSTAPGGLTNPMPSVGAVGGGLGAIQPNLGSLIPPPGAPWAASQHVQRPVWQTRQQTPALAACRGRRQPHWRSLRSGRQRWQALAAHRHRQLRRDSATLHHHPVPGRSPDRRLVTVRFRSM